jgi:DNA-binding transcriptional regulator YdaS (Cro superfamily)
MARLCGVTQPAVWKWMNERKVLPAEHVRAVEAATGISRGQLRPDLYPPEEYSQSPAARAGEASAEDLRRKSADAIPGADAHADARDPLEGFRP